MIISASSTVPRKTLTHQQPLLTILGSIDQEALAGGCGLTMLVQLVFRGAALPPRRTAVRIPSSRPSSRGDLYLPQVG